MSELVFTIDGSPVRLFKDSSFELSLTQVTHQIGTINVGGFMYGSSILTDEDGINILHPDGTKHFINWTWFNKLPI